MKFENVVILASVLSLAACSSRDRGSPDQGASPSTRPAASAHQARAVVEYKNGQWFDGNQFVSGSRYTADGVLHSTRPAGATATTVIDLRNGHVVPPYGEGHTHLLEAELIDTYVHHFLYRGIYYVKDQSSPPWVREQIASKVNKLTSIDVRWANQGFTGPGGHPLQIMKQMQTLGAIPADWSAEKLATETAIAIADEAGLDARWPGFLAGKPDFVKVFLLYSEEYDKRKDTPEYEHRRGIDPALVPAVVARARSAGLEVSAHVYTAADFRAAVEAGVSQIAHMPGIGFDETLGPDAFKLGEIDARRAAEKGVSVITTLSELVEDMRVSPEVGEYFTDVVAMNYKLLRDAGVPILIGSDRFRSACDTEAVYLSELGLMDNLTLLKTWTEATPQMIFPDRKIGKLTDGYEASFLVLDGNPLDDPANLLRIGLRVKQGQILVVKNARFAAPVARE